MKLPSSRTHQDCRGRQGFTLVELLVVIVIIGILVALLIPAVMAAMRTTRNATITTEINVMSSALQSMATSKQVPFPPAFSGAGSQLDGGSAKQKQLVDQYLGQMYRYRDAVLDVPINWFTGQPVDFATLDCAEALAFWLLGPTDNAQYPLCGQPNDGSIVLWFPTDAAAANYRLATRTAWADLDPTRLNDKDKDGFPEYYPAHGGENVQPYVYYPNTEYAKVYRRAVGAAPYSGQFLPRYFLSPEATPQIAPLPYLGNIPASITNGGASAVMVIDQLVQKTNFAEADRFQILAPGLDGVYMSQGSEDRQVAWYQTYSYANGPYSSENNDTGHRDNITNFAGGTLESKMP